MSKNKKQPLSKTPSLPRSEKTWSPLTDLEEEISLVCLRYFRGDWDMYLDHLAGTRVTESQRERELPIVEKLKARDRQTDFLAALVEDEVVAMVERLDFDGLYRLWEFCLLLHREADPYPRTEPTGGDVDESAGDPPPSLH